MHPRCIRTLLILLCFADRVSDLITTSSYGFARAEPAPIMRPFSAIPRNAVFAA